MLSETLVFVGFLFVGAVMGLLGGGGAVLSIPLLVYGYGLNSNDAVKVTVVVIFFVSLFSTISYGLRKKIHYSTAIFFVVFGAVGSILGTQVRNFFDPQWLMLLFSIAIFFLALRMIFKKVLKVEKKLINKKLLSIMCFSIGLLTGVLGISGGFLIVPILVSLFHYPLDLSVGTSVFVIIFNTASAVLSAYSGSLEIIRVNPDILTIIAIAVSSAVGASLLSSKIDQPSARRVLGFFILIVATAIFLKESYGIMTDVG